MYQWPCFYTVNMQLTLHNKFPEKYNYKTGLANGQSSDHWQYDPNDLAEEGEESDNVGDHDPVEKAFDLWNSTSCCNRLKRQFIVNYYKKFWT